MSDVTNCLTCGAVCRILGQDAEGLPKLRAFQNTEAQKKIEQLKNALHHLQETLRTLTGDCKSKDSIGEKRNSQICENLLVWIEAIAKPVVANPSKDGE
jgi:hypothetical protein